MSAGDRSKKRQAVASFPEESVLKETALANFCCTNVITGECKSLATAQRLYPHQNFEAKGDDRCYPTSSRCASQCKLPNAAWDFIMESEPNVNWEQALELKPGQKLGSYSTISLVAQTAFQELLIINGLSSEYMNDVHDKLVKLRAFVQFGLVRVNDNLFKEMIRVLMQTLYQVETDGDPDVDTFTNVLEALIVQQSLDATHLRTYRYLFEFVRIDEPNNLQVGSFFENVFNNNTQFTRFTYFPVIVYQRELPDIIQEFLQRYSEFDWIKYLAHSAEHVWPVMSRLPRNFLLSVAILALERLVPFDYLTVLENMIPNETTSDDFIFIQLFRQVLLDYDLIRRDVSVFDRELREAHAHDKEIERNLLSSGDRKSAVQSKRFFRHLKILSETQRWNSLKTEKATQLNSRTADILIPRTWEEKRIVESQPFPPAQLPDFPQDVIRQIGEYNADIFSVYQQTEGKQWFIFLQEIETKTYGSFTDAWDDWTRITVLLGYSERLPTLAQIYQIIRLIPVFLVDIRVASEAEDQMEEPIEVEEDEQDSDDDELEVAEKETKVIVERRRARVELRLQVLLRQIYRWYPGLRGSFDFYRFLIEEFSKVNFSEALLRWNKLIPAFEASPGFYLGTQGQTLVTIALDYISMEFQKRILDELTEGGEIDPYNPDRFPNLQEQNEHVVRFWAFISCDFQIACFERAMRGYPDVLFPFTNIAKRLPLSVKTEPLLLETIPLWLSTFEEKQKIALSRAEQATETLQELRTSIFRQREIRYRTLSLIRSDEKGDKPDSEFQRKLKEEVAKYTEELKKLYIAYGKAMIVTVQLSLGSIFKESYQRILDIKIQKAALNQDPLGNRMKVYLTRQDVTNREEKFERQQKADEERRDMILRGAVQQRERERGIVGLNPQNLLVNAQDQAPAPAAAQRAQYPLPGQMGPNRGGTIKMINLLKRQF